MSDSAQVALFPRVRLLLRRYIVGHASWLPSIEDGPAGKALVNFLNDGDKGRDGDVLDAVARLSEQLGDRATAGTDPNTVARRFALLSERLELGPEQQDLLWLLLAPEFEPVFLAIYRLLWGDVRQRFCDEDFVHSVLSDTGRAGDVHLLSDASALVRTGMIHRIAPHAEVPAVYRPDPRLVDYLAGDDRVAPALAEHVTLWPASAPAEWDGLVLAPKARAALGPPPAATLLHAAKRAGVRELLRQSLGDAGLPLVSADLKHFLQPADKPPLLADGAAILRGLLREARFAGAALHLSGLEHLKGVELHHCHQLARLLAGEPGPLLLECAGTIPVEVLDSVVVTLRPRHLRVEAADGFERGRLWRHLLRDHEHAGDDDQISRLAAHPIGPEAMTRVLSVHRATGEPLDAIARQFVTHRLAELAERVEVPLQWEDVVMSPRVATQISEIRTFGRNYDRIMTRWGLGRIASGRGIKVLFSGPSGTGKTLISGLLARDLGRELFRIELSSIVSKYIGETEKHLTRLFDEARDADAAILFDEADSLFAKRTSVKSSVDRYANQGVNHLLQLLEAFDGLVILTTNLDDSFDSAFARRLSYHIKFPRPEAAERKELWRVHLPSTLPLGDDVDLDALGYLYELTGGEIRKTVIKAAVMAVQTGAEVVGLRELENAARAVYVSSGKLPPSQRLLHDDDV